MEEFDLLKKHFSKAKTHYFRSQSCFGGSHPYSGIELPEHTQELVKVTKNFLIVSICFMVSKLVLRKRTQTCKLFLKDVQIKRSLANNFFQSLLFYSESHGYKMVGIGIVNFGSDAKK
jgi:hypothetical protein